MDNFTVTFQTVKITAYWLIFGVQLILSATSYIPQIIKLVRVKKSTGVSFATWLISLFDFVSYQLLLVLDQASFSLQILNLIQIVQIVTVLILIKKYE